MSAVEEGGGDGVQGEDVATSVEGVEHQDVKTKCDAGQEQQQQGRHAATE